jgi:tryptophan synthase alpha chain
MRQVTNLPLAVGFGVSTPEHVAEVARVADGVVVGSAIVRQIEGGAQDPDLAEQVAAFIRRLTAPLRAR